MKKCQLILLLLSVMTALSQTSREPATSIEAPFENIAENSDNDIEDDTYLQQIDFYRRHPLNLNVADEGEIALLKILNELQLKNFISYRRLMGNLISIYELQAIPGWDITLIHQILPYVTVNDEVNLNVNFFTRWKGGVHALLLRYATILEKPKGYNTPISPSSAFYIGSRSQMMMRYKYNYKNLLQFSLLGKKDAGEEFFAGSQKQGFGFYSGHLILRNLGPIRCLVLGDFTVNLGQGLMQWQSYTFGKSAASMAVKKQSPVLLPYSSTGEFNYQRGIGLTLGRRRWEATVFLSYRNLSGNLSTDTTGTERQVTSFNTSGLYRTASELADRSNTRQFSFGSSVKYKTQDWQVAINAVNDNFSEVLQKRPDLYNLYSINGRSWWNLGTDYSYTRRNMHLFGEVSVDKNFNTALLNGLLMSLDSKLDIAVLYRNIDKKYQALYAAAFTENTAPSNEKGLYVGISIRPFPSITVNGYADIFHFPWLKYGVNEASQGRDYLLQLNFVTGRNVSLYTRVHSKISVQNEPDLGTIFQPTTTLSQFNWRIHADIALEKQSALSQRIEITWINNNMPKKEEGMLAYIEYSKRFVKNRINSSLRLQYFETDSYASRIYAFEKDILYTVSIPSFFDKGLRYYINARIDCSQLLRKISPNTQVKMNAWLKWSQTIFAGKTVVGEALDEISGNRKTSIRAQILIFF